MIISTIPDFALQYDEQLSLLRVHWAAGTDMHGIRTSTEEVYQLCQTLKMRYWLLDMDTFPDISVYDQLWLSSYWIPKLFRLPLERVVLVIHHRRVHNQMATEALIAAAQPFIQFDIQYFSSTRDGLHWLSDYSERLPDLIAEWEEAYGTLKPDKTSRFA